MANDVEKRITAKMVLDSTGYNDSIKGVNSSLRQAQSELKNASAQVGVFGRDSEKLKSVQEALAKQVELHAKKVGLYKENIEKATAKMNDNIRERDKLKISLDKANKSYEEAVKLYGKESKQVANAKEEVSKLEKEYKNKEKAVESNAKQTQRYETNLNKANLAMVKTQGELKEVNTELDKSNNKWIQASDTLQKSSDKLKDVGGKIEGAGDKVLKLSAPLVGAGAASLKFSTDFNKAMANVSTLIPGQQKRLMGLKKDVQEVSVEVGKSTEDIADGTYQVISAFGDVSDTMEKVKINAKAATAGVSTTTDALNLSSAVMKGYGDTTAEANQKVMDMAFMTVKLGQTDFPQLASSIGKVVPLSNELKVTQEELFTVFATGTGVTGTASEVSTQYRGILQSLLAPTKDMTALIEQMGYADGKAMIEKQGLAGAIETIVKKAKETNTPLQKYIGSIEGQTLALALAGEQSDVYKEKLEQMKDGSGAMEEAFKQQTEGINKQGFAFKQSMIKMQVAGQKFGDAIAPVLGNISELISNLADKIASMDEEQLKAIANIGLLTVGLGGVLKVGGGAISTVGSIAGGLSKLTGALGAAKVATTGVGTAAGVAGGAGGLGALATGLGGAVVAAGPFLLAGAAVAGVGYAVHKGMSQEAVPAVDLFANKVQTTTVSVNGNAATMGAAYQTAVTKISESTKTAVGAYLQLDESTKQHLDSLYINSTEITEEMKNELINKYEKMGSEINTGIEKKRTENIQGLKEFFDDSSAITVTEEAEIMQKTQQYYEQKKLATKMYEIQIKNIIQNASNEKRALTANEVTKINNLQRKMKEEAVKILSENELEAKIILERMKEYDNRITAEQAAQHIKTLNESKKKAINAANEEYEKRIATIIKMRDEAGVISEEQAEALIADAQRQRDEIIKSAEETKEKAIEKMKEMNEDLVNQVDTTDGHIRTKWEKLKNWFANNPIIRRIKTVLSGGGGGEVGHNWTGTTYWRGGPTYIHERGYEIYDLPRGTRIYNHEASEDLVKKTAEAVALKMAAGNNVSNDNRSTHLHIGTLIADEYGLKQLERKLSSIRIGEKARLGVAE